MAFPHARRFCAVLLSFGLAAGCWSSGIVRGDLTATDRRGFAPLVEKVAPAVVSIQASGGQTEKRDDDDTSRRGRQSPGRNADSSKQSVTDGSGVIVSADGYIVTNYHVIKSATHIAVKREDVGKQYEAVLVGSDSQTDLAVLHIQDNNLPTLTFAESGSYRVGDIVLAIGNPLSFANSVSQGIISAVGRSLNNGAVEDYIQTDAAINPGNSGGALVDLEGRLIGINSLYVPVFGSKVNSGLGFAIAAALVKSVYEEIRAEGKVQRAYAGLQLQDLSPGLAIMFSLPENTFGVLITEVAPDSPAQKAGLHVKDIVQEFNGKALTSAIQLRELITFSKPDSEVSLTTLRNGSFTSVKLRLARFPDSSSNNDLNEENIPLSGLTLGELTQEVRRQNTIPNRVRGVFISHVRAGSVAEKLNFRTGMVLSQVNETSIASVSQAEGVLRQFTRGVVYLWTTNGYIYVPIDLHD
jgi:serine protease Do